MTAMTAFSDVPEGAPRSPAPGKKKKTLNPKRSRSGCGKPPLGAGWEIIHGFRSTADPNLLSLGSAAHRRENRLLAATHRLRECFLDM